MIPEWFAANVAWLFTERPWLDRFGAARDAGFATVEFPWPEHPVATARAVHDAGLRVALLNAPAGDLAAGERGWPNDPRRVDEWRDGFRSALSLAGDVGCPTINVLAGNRIGHTSDDAQLSCLDGNLRWALEAASGPGIAVVTEVLNRHENPEYLLVSLDDADPLLASVGPMGWCLQLDTWHLGSSEPDVPGAIRRVAQFIGHVQVADVPGRHEPGTGGLDWSAIGDALRGAGYRGSIGLEYRPTGGFAWVADSELARRTS